MGILQGELEKARIIQNELPAIRFREAEQAVVATFLHSQPVGQKASTVELMRLLGHTRPDKIELDKMLRRWTEVSWFLDEADISTTSGEQSALPNTWRMGSKPNLKQMHSEACTRVKQLIDTQVIDAINKQRSLTSGASGAGARVHNMPTKPSDVEDDGEFHYVVLGPKAASASGHPSPEAKRFIDETTAADRPRVNRNSVVLAVPSRDGLDAIRSQIREYLGWEEVRTMLKGQALDPLREGLLSSYIEAARKKIPEAVRQAYCIVVTVSDKNDIQAFKLTIGGDALFSQITADSRSRIQDTPISADALLPGGPYDLWRESETSRRVKDLVGAFAQFPHLPKMLRRKEIIGTLVDGARQGFFVLQATRPDRSVRTIWRQEPQEADLKDPSLELVLPESANLTEIAPGLLLPDALPELWPATREIKLSDAFDYFGGGHVVKVQREGYEEPVTIPKAERDVVEQAVTSAVESGKLWLVSGTASIMAETIPAGILNEAAQLLPPPQQIPTMDVLPPNLPEAWKDGLTTAVGVSVALSQKSGKTLPWATVREAIDGAIRARMLEKAEDSGPWPCDLEHVTLRSGAL